MRNESPVEIDHSSSEIGDWKPADVIDERKFPKSFALL